MEKPASETMLSKIICSVEEAQAKKGKLQRFSDAFGVYYTPAMFVLGVLVATVPPLFLGAEWLPFIYRGLVVFVVSCSCGLALSVPVAIVAAMAKAAHQGTVFKGGAYLEVVDRVKVIAFDKTGTLTIGRPEVTDVLTFGGVRASRRCWTLPAASSRGPGIHWRLRSSGRRGRAGRSLGSRWRTFRRTPGLASRPRSAGGPAWSAAPAVIQEQGVSLEEAEEAVARLENEGKTVVLVSTDGRLTGLVAIADTVRPGAVEALQRLSRAGVRTVMLTGDNERSAAAIATSGRGRRV